jgi:prepilin-type N-terminal cleavage/methylation domain-containing protein
MDFKRGFTFIELAVSLALISILLSVCIPIFKDYNRLKQSTLLDMSSIELLSDLRLCQETAKYEGDTCNIFFNSTERSYYIYIRRDTRDDHVVKRKNLPQGIRVDNTRSTYTKSMLSFDRAGKPLPNPCTIIITNNLGQYKSITITVATDYISIKDD